MLVRWIVFILICFIISVCVIGSIIMIMWMVMMVGGIVSGWFLWKNG